MARPPRAPGRRASFGQVVHQTGRRKRGIEVEMKDSETNRNSDALPAIRSPLWSSFAIVALAALIGAAMAFAAAELLPAQYRATGQIFIDTSSQSVNDIGRVGQTQAALAASNQVLSEAAKSLDLPATALRGKVSAVFASEAAYITLSATGSNAKEAALRVVAVERAYEGASTAQHQAQYQDAARRLKDQGNSLAKDLTNVQKSLAANPSDVALTYQQNLVSRQLTDASNRLAEATLSANSVGSGVALFEVPDAEASVRSPRPLVVCVAGLILGILVGSLISWLRWQARRQQTVPAHGRPPSYLGTLLGPEVTAESLRETGRRVLGGMPLGAQVLAVVLSTDSGYTAWQAVHGLATALRKAGEDLLIIDSDPRGAAYRALVDAESEAGPSTVSAERGLGARQRRPELSRLQRGGRLSAEELDELLQSPSNSGRLAVFIMGSVVGPSSRRVLARADAVVLLAERDRLPAAGLALQGALASSTIPLVGYVSFTADLPVAAGERGEDVFTMA
jgi:capsular polysaccharide biosynthesis protein